MGKLQGRTDIPLNSIGIFRAEECSRFLKNYEWDVMITSPLKRAKETAEVINKDLDIPLIKMDEFVERFFGDAEGMTVEERLKAFPTRKYPNQEDRDALNKRIMSGTEK